MDVVVEDLGELRLAAITHLGPRNMIGEAFQQVAALAAPAGLFANPGAAAVAVFHGDPARIPAEQLRSDAGVIVPASSTIPDGLVEVRIPAGTYARATHRGHYAHLGDSWDLLRRWLPGSGRRAVGDFTFEVYRVADHSQPDKLETDLYLAVA